MEMEKIQTRKLSIILWKCCHNSTCYRENTNFFHCTPNYGRKYFQNKCNDIIHFTCTQNYGEKSFQVKNDPFLWYFPHIRSLKKIIIDGKPKHSVHLHAKNLENSYYNKGAIARLHDFEDMDSGVEGAQVILEIGDKINFCKFGAETFLEIGS